LTDKLDTLPTSFWLRENCMSALSGSRRALLSPLHRLAPEFVQNREWAARAYAPPSPAYIKRKVLVRNGLENATWVETGTYRGETTRMLSEIAQMVFSIEPEPGLHSAAERAFEGIGHVRILLGTSEEIFPRLIPDLQGDICYWLDGHYSAGETFKGPQDTPIIDELKVISENIGNHQNIAVMIDDVRCFDPQDPRYSAYPPLDFLVDWARQNGFKWHIEHDIFVATRTV
jgi:hypothetical protein